MTLPSDVTYTPLREREALLIRVVKQSYCRYINEYVLPEEVVVKQCDESVYVYDVYESGERTAYISINKAHWDRIMDGNADPKVHSNQFKKI